MTHKPKNQRMPPIEAISQWIKDKNLNVDAEHVMDCLKKQLESPKKPLKRKR